MNMLIELIVASSALCTSIQVYQKHNKKKQSLPESPPLKKKPLANPVYFDKTQSPIEKGERSANQVSHVKGEVNQGLLFALGGLSLAVAGSLFFQPLRLLSVPFLVCEIQPILADAYQSLVTKGKVNVNTLTSIVIVVCLTKGYLITSGLTGVLYHWSRKLLDQVKDDSRKSLIDVFEQFPRLVWTLDDGVEIETPFDALKVGDIVIASAGEIIAVDGIITNGIALIDQHLLTGESQPVEKEVGDSVFALTVVLSGQICIKVEKAGIETTAAQIGQILNRTIDFKTERLLWTEQMTDKMIIPTLIVGALSFPILGASGAASVINSPPKYRLSIVVPISILHFFNVLSDKGILVKDGRTLEMLNQVDTIVFDKTGTLTLEQPQVGRIYVYKEFDESQILTYAAAAEYKQTHPIAKAIQQETHLRALNVPEIDEAKYQVGYGVKVTIDTKIVWVGSIRFIEMANMIIPHQVKETQNVCHEQGYSLVLVAINNEVVGAIELHATVRPATKESLCQLRQRGLKSMYIISGDQEAPTKKLAEELSIDHYFAETLPEAKADLIAQLQQEGKFVCYIGDGINDAIAMKKAQVSISLRGASSVATDTAQIILMNESMSQLVPLFDTAKAFENNMKSTFLATIVPSFINLGGTLFLGFGVAHSLVFGLTGLLAGSAYAVLPQLRYQRQAKFMNDEHGINTL